MHMYSFKYNIFFWHSCCKSRMITGKPVISICVLQHQILLNDLDHKLLSIYLHIVLIVYIGFCCVKDIKNKLTTYLLTTYLLTTLLITKVLSSFAICGGHFIYVSFSGPGPEFLRTAWLLTPFWEGFSQKTLYEVKNLDFVDISL